MRRFLYALGLFSIFILITPLAMPQSLTSGDISGTVSDPSGAVIKDAIVNLKSLDTGAAQTTATGNSGMYRFSLLKPGRYNLKAAQPGFQGAERQVTVAIGQVTLANFVLTVGTATELIEVTGALPVVNTESAAISTTYDVRSVSELPNSGADISNIAQLAPGVTMNTMSQSAGGYGNFTANGMSATSNLFTINGENYMDPFFNINNTGATNLSLGQNEIQEASIVTNPYSGQYGQQAGAQVNYITKSGTNAFHGSAKYMWNGRVMNANNWFNNNTDPKTPRPFVNANQWGADFGGPIQKDKTFFYVNTEGLRLLIPTTQNTYIPTQTFANAVLANIEATQPNSLPLYQKLFGVWMAAPGAQNAKPIPGSCDTATGIMGLTDTTACVANFSATPGQLTHEWILSGRVDHNFSDNDRVFVRFKRDDGLQATRTDPINSAFNATSSQPAYDGQLQWNHVFSGTATNQFIMSGNYYSAIFKQNEALAIQTFPYDVTFSGLSFTNFGGQRSYPQGRNVTQYQFIDDFTKIVGNHTFKVGANYRRYDVSDYNFFYKHPRLLFNDMGNLAAGYSYYFRQWFSQSSSVPIALYGLGIYGQDEWKVNNKLKLTLALRAEHNSNPVCQNNCFSLFTAPFNALQHGPDVPYNQDIQTGLHQAYRATDKLNLSPRLGFTWSPFTNEKTIISGGIGIFYDALSQGGMEDAFSNTPFVNQFNVYGVGDQPGALWADPGRTGAAAIAASSNAALLAGFSAGQTYNQIRAATGDVFAAPLFTNFAGTMRTPQFQEWNLQVQQAIGNNMSVSLNYFGNHGIYIPVVNGNLNAYDPGYCGDPSGNGVPCGAGFPSTRPDRSYGTVSEWYTGAISNSNGLTATFTRRFAQGVSFQANYTWSHALDEVSNGGVSPYTFDQPQAQINPLSLRANNYGNADYDIRHNFNANFVWEPPHRFSNSMVNGIVGGWMFSGSLFARSGSPYTVIDSNTFFPNLGGFGLIPAQALGPGATYGSGPCQNGNSQCYDPNAFVNSVSPTWDATYAATGNPVYTAFPTQRRNQYRGPGFFNTNFSVMKNFSLTERMKFGFGANFYNVFNHSNFYVPNVYLADGDSTSGRIQETVSPSASAFGNFLGADASPRLIQLNAKITF
jgi:outer membrane receptor protein involved in Fe transport